MTNETDILATQGAQIQELAIDPAYKDKALQKIKSLVKGNKCDPESITLKEFEGKILFLENYDMELGQRLVKGVDIWMNTPTRPLEASGTSGEKAVMNGVLNFSVLDGSVIEGPATQPLKRYNTQFDGQILRIWN